MEIYAYIVIIRMILGFFWQLRAGEAEGVGVEIGLALVTTPLIGRVLGWW